MFSVKNLLDDAPCVRVSQKRDIAVVVDLYQQNIQFIVALVDSLAVTKNENHVGVVATQTANAMIEVKFNDKTSQVETALLGEIRGAAKDAGFQPSNSDYDDAITRVQELFTQKNGDRSGAKNVLLIVTDATKEFALATAAAGKINDLKVGMSTVGE